MEFLHNLDGMQAYLLLSLLLLIEELGIPLPMLPGDLLLMAGGYLAAIGVLHLSLFIAGASFAITAGAFGCYVLSRHLGRPVVTRWGRIVGLSAHRVTRAERWLHRNGTAAVTVARVLPGTRISMSMAAGCLRLPFRDFVFGVLPSSVLFAGTFTLVGFALGDRVTPLLPWYDRAAVGLGVLAAIVVVLVWIARRRRGGCGRAPVEAAV